MTKNSKTKLTSTPPLRGGREGLGLLLFLLALLLCCCEGGEQPYIKPIEPSEKTPLDTVYINRAEDTFEKIFEYLWDGDLTILYDKYPNGVSPNYWEKYAAVWGYGALLSAYNTTYQYTPSFSSFERLYKTNVMDGLETYWNDSKRPAAYGSYHNDWDDRFYDDNVWIGIDLIELYDRTKDAWYLERAKLIWTFLMAGKDDVLGGGIYWKEGELNSKNTCSNAPTIVFGAKLYQTTKENVYLDTAKELYQWTKKNLQDASDYLYWDNMKTNGIVETPKYSYNSGQMIQAGVLLYNITKNESYLNDAENVAESSYNYFFEDYRLSATGETIKMLKRGSLWFHAIMLRGFAELYEVEKDTKYIVGFRQSLDHAWRNARDPQTGLFNSDLSGRTTDEAKDILTQGAIVEMYARVAICQ